MIRGFWIERALPRPLPGSDRFFGLFPGVFGLRPRPRANFWDPVGIGGAENRKKSAGSGKPEAHMQDPGGIADISPGSRPYSGRLPGDRDLEMTFDPGSGSRKPSTVSDASDVSGTPSGVRILCQSEPGVVVATAPRPRANFWDPVGIWDAERRKPQTKWAQRFDSGRSEHVNVTSEPMKILLLASLFMMGSVNAGDHDERRVPLDEVTIKSNKYGAEAKLTLKEDGSLRLVVTMNGKPVVIPDLAIAPIKDADLASAAFSTETPTGVPVAEWKLKGGIILSCYFGDKVTQGFRKNRREGVLSACRIKISADGKYERIETAVPLGEESFRWRILVQSKDGQDIRRETVDSYDCPIPMRWN